MSRSGPSPKRTKPAPGCRSNSERGGRDKLIEALFRTQPAGGRDEAFTPLREESLQFLPTNRVGRAEAVDADGVTDHRRAFRRNAGATDLDGLRFGYARHRVHAPHNPAVQHFGHAHAQRGGGPAVGDGDDGDAGLTPRQPTDQIGLITAATKHIGV